MYNLQSAPADENIFLKPDEDDIRQWRAYIRGPPETPFAGGGVQGLGEGRGRGGRSLVNSVQSRFLSFAESIYGFITSVHLRQFVTSDAAFPLAAVGVCR